MFFKILLFSILFVNVTFGFNIIDSKENNCESLPDSLNINSHYLITAKDGSHFNGILTGQDSVKIIVRNSRGKELNIFRSQIEKIQDKQGNIVYQAVEVIEEEEILQTKDEIKIQNDTTQKCNIYLTNKILLKDVMIIDAADSTFKILKSDFTHEYKIADINSIKFINHGFGKGLMYGEMASVLFFGLIGLLAIDGGGHPDYFGKGAGFAIGFILGIPIGLISGVVCEFLTKDDEYDLSKLSTGVKAKRLRFLFHKYKE